MLQLAKRFHRCLDYILFDQNNNQPNAIVIGLVTEKLIFYFIDAPVLFYQRLGIHDRYCCHIYNIFYST